MGLVWLFLIGIGGYIAFIVYAIQEVAQRKKKMRSAIASLRDFSCSDSFMDGRGNTAIAVDNARATLCFLRRGARGIETSTVHACDIVSADIVQDGVMQTVHSGSSGGILMLGRVGVPVGGHSRQVTSERVTQIDLRVVVNDSAYPTRAVPFLAYAANRGEATYEFARDAARDWLARIDVMVKQARAPRAHISGPTFNVADELRKLASLRDEGLLSEREFDSQRSKLLASRTLRLLPLDSINVHC